VDSIALALHMPKKKPPEGGFFNSGLLRATIS
jgi:hypothetical protein